MFLFLATDEVQQEMDATGKHSNNDWVFINYTFKRFEGLTQRGVLKPSTFKS